MPLRTRSLLKHLARAQGSDGFGFTRSASHASTIRRVTSGSSSLVAIGKVVDLQRSLHAYPKQRQRSGTLIETRGSRRRRALLPPHRQLCAHHQPAPPGVCTSLQLMHSSAMTLCSLCNRAVS